MKGKSKPGSLVPPHYPLTATVRSYGKLAACVQNSSPCLGTLHKHCTVLSWKNTCGRQSRAPLPHSQPTVRLRTASNGTRHRRRSNRIPVDPVECGVRKPLMEEGCSNHALVLGMTWGLAVDLSKTSPYCCSDTLTLDVHPFLLMAILHPNRTVLKFRLCISVLIWIKKGC